MASQSLTQEKTPENKEVPGEYPAKPDTSKTQKQYIKKYANLEEYKNSLDFYCNQFTIEMVALLLPEGYVPIPERWDKNRKVIFEEDGSVTIHG